MEQSEANLLEQLTREIENFQDIARYLIPQPGETPRLEGIDVWGGTVPLGIPLGAGVIAGAWLLTAAYVVWANREYDPEVERLRSGRGVE